MIEIKQAIIENIVELAVLFDKYRIFYKKTSDLMGAKEFLQARITNQESTIFIRLLAKVIYAAFALTKVAIKVALSPNLL